MMLTLFPTPEARAPRPEGAQAKKPQNMQLCSLPLFGDHARQIDLEDYLKQSPHIPANTQNQKDA